MYYVKTIENNELISAAINVRLYSILAKIIGTKFQLKLKILNFEPN